MSVRTRQDLAKRALQKLRKLEAQEEVAAEDFAILDDVYANKFDELTSRDLTYWPVDEIPSEAFEDMARIIADEVSADFGVPTPIEMDENGAQVSMGVRGIRGLRRIMQTQKSGLPAQALYF